MCEGCLDAMLAAIIQKELKEKPNECGCGPIVYAEMDFKPEWFIHIDYRTRVDMLMDAARADVAANERRRRAAK
jgi:hypothetical protein